MSPGPGVGDLDALEPLVAVQARDLGVRDAAVVAAEADVLPLGDVPVEHAPDREAADVVVPVEVRDQELERERRVEARRGHRAEDRLEERLQGGVGAVRLRAAGAAAGVAVEDREVELVLGGVEVDEEVEDLVEDLGRAGVGAVDLVDHDDRRQAGLEGLAQDEAGLGQRPLAGVHQEHHAVDHLQGALDLAAEVRVPGGVHDVDARPAVGDGGVLRHDRDALLALEVDRVHHPLPHRLVLAEDPALPEHRVHQRGLAVVHVRDDRHVADLVARSRSPSLLPLFRRRGG